MSLKCHLLSYATLQKVGTKKQLHVRFSGGLTDTDYIAQKAMLTDEYKSDHCRDSTCSVRLIATISPASQIIDMDSFEDISLPTSIPIDYEGGGGGNPAYCLIA